MFSNTYVGAVSLAWLIISTTMPSAALAAEWPDRPVRIIVAAAAGGTSDRITRIVATRLSTKWGKPVIVENRGGGTTIIATDTVAKSPADGYTLLSTFTSFVQIPFLFKKLPFDVERDLAPVTQLAAMDVVLMVRSDSPYKSLPDFAAAAKKAKPPLSYGTFGTGSSHHIYGEMMAKGLGVELTHVPYKGEGPPTADLLGGHLDSSFASTGTALPHLKSGQLRALALVSAERSRILPNVPSFAEFGVRMPDVKGWYGFLAPAKTPSQIVHKISADVREILAEPDIIEFLRDQGLDPIANTPEAFTQRVHSELSHWKKLLFDAGIQPAD